MVRVTRFSVVENLFCVHPTDCTQVRKWDKKRRKKIRKNKSTRTIELGTSFFFQNSRAIGIAIIFLVEPSVNRDKGSGQTIERYAAGEGEEGGRGGEGSASMRCRVFRAKENSEYDDRTSGPYWQVIDMFAICASSPFSPRTESRIRPWPWNVTSL